MREVSVICESDPPIKCKKLDLTLKLVRPDGQKVVVLRQEQELEADGIAEFQLGDFPVLIGGLDSQHLHCEVKGKYHLEAEILYQGVTVAVARRIFYVRQDPPGSPSSTPISIMIEVVNSDEPERKRVNHGKDLYISVALKNRTNKDIIVSADAILVASELPNHLLAGVDVPESLQLFDSSVNGQITLPGTPLGAAAVPVNLFTTHVRLFNDTVGGYTDSHMVLAAGRHRMTIDVREINGTATLSRSRFVYFESDPPGAGGGLPFLLRRRDQEHATEAWPSWDMDNDEDGENYVIFYYGKHHIYELVRDADRAGNNSHGTEAFVSEITCDALIDWAYEYYKVGDESRLNMIAPETSANGLEVTARRSRLREQMERYWIDAASDDATPELLSKRRREIVANMVKVSEEGQS